ncbi:MAG: oxidoreductase [Pseudomonadota bacterium]
MPTTSAPLIRNWTPDETPDLTGKTFLITGGNSGIGFEAAKLLAQNNADVVIACRNQTKAKAALAKIVNCGAGQCEVLALDLADSALIRAAAKEAGERFGAIYGLINNAGVMQTPKQKTKDGFEMQLGINHLGHVLWTTLMIGQVDGRGGRVVTVASIAHKYARLDFDNLMLDRGYDSLESYTRSKLANLLYAQELHRRLEAAGSKIKSIACHPGYSTTPLFSKTSNPVMRIGQELSSRVLGQSQDRGAWPTVLAATDERAVSGGYYGPTGFFDMRGAVGDAIIEPRAADEAVAKRLWEVSEELVGEKLAV